MNPSGTNNTDSIYSGTFSRFYGLAVKMRQKAYIFFEQISKRKQSLRESFLTCCRSISFPLSFLVFVFFVTRLKYNIQNECQAETSGEEQHSARQCFSLQFLLHTLCLKCLKTIEDYSGKHHIRALNDSGRPVSALLYRRTSTSQGLIFHICCQ